MAKDIGTNNCRGQGRQPPLAAYNHALIVEPGRRLMFVAGQVAVNEQGDTVGAGDLAAQIRQVFHNIGQVLGSADASFENVVQFTTYMVRTQKVEDFISGRREAFAAIYPNEDYPTNTLLIIDGLVREEFLIEVEAIAVLP